MKKKVFFHKKTKYLWVFFLLLIVFGLALWYVSPIIRRVSSFYVLKQQISTELIGVVANGKLNSDSVDRILSNQISFSYDESHPACDREIYSCDIPDLKPTKTESESRYFLTGYLYSEYRYLSEEEYRNYLSEKLDSNYFYSEFWRNGGNINIFYTSNTKKDAIVLQITDDNGGQIIKSVLVELY